MKVIKARLLLTLSVILLSFVTSASDVTINVHGSVVATPCTTILSDIDVDFGDIFSTTLDSAGASTDWKEIKLDLDGCPVGTSSVNIKFSGAPSVVDNNYYLNSGTAEDIVLELQDSDSTLLKNNESRTMDVNFLTGKASFPVKVRVRSLTGNPTDGTISSTISVSYTYN
ncbi:fimbrial protein [Serratia ureilytica]|uniref:fimbrial protein n=1 Tax=Serratia ureilytica TaxID=300181 RepID=UPI0034C6A1D3